MFPTLRYYDKATMDFVMRRDKFIVEKFGYETCCPPAPPAEISAEL